MLEERVVRVIAPTVQKENADSAAITGKRRVAAYARVSTEEEEQLTSYENQADYYTKYIKSRPDWEFVGLYADEGISGLNTKKRDGFKQMVKDAMEGRIDLILTKSVSRFARNTVDSIVTIRQLKEKGVEVYFEKENIYTLDSKGELMLTIMSSLAQEESRSISENITWGVRKNMERGKVVMAYSRFLGYKKGSDGKPEIDEKEAEVVRRIYNLYLDGGSAQEISRILTRDGIPTPSGKKSKWGVSTIMSILRNEKYKGDALLQKVYTVDFLNKKLERNNGVLPQYYVEKSHPAIIDAETFDLVQQELEKRGNESRGRLSDSVFNKKVVCGDCGHYYGRKLWYSDSAERIYVWRCTHKYDVQPICQTPVVREEELKSVFLAAFNQLLQKQDDYIASLESELKNESETAQPARLGKIRRYLDALKKQPVPTREFSDTAFMALAENITISNDGNMMVCFKDGTKINVTENAKLTAEEKD